MRNIYSLHSFIDMNEERYFDIESTTDYHLFTFISQGKHGSLTKLVSFDAIDDQGKIFNLALGTITSDGQIDFTTTTNNGDRNKVLATVAEIVRIFLDNNTEKSVYLTGSDERRTVLYHRAIAYAYIELIQSFNIYGQTSPEIEDKNFDPFDSTITYYGFLIKNKNY